MYSAAPVGLGVPPWGGAGKRTGVCLTLLSQGQTQPASPRSGALSGKREEIPLPPEESVRDPSLPW